MWTDLYEKIRQFYRASLKPSWKNMLASKATYAPLALTFVLLDMLFCLPFFIRSASMGIADAFADGYTEALRTSVTGFSATLRHLSAGSGMLLLLGLCLWLPLCLCVLSVVFRAEIDSGKFVHGLYITFGADTKRLQFLLCLQFVSLCVVLTLPSWLLTGIIATLFYAIGGFGCRWHIGCFWLSLLVMPLLTWLCIGLQASRLVRQAPIRLLAASSVADSVSSPRKSADVSGKNQPLRLSCLGIFRMRRYYIPLILICSLCASGALGLFAAGRGTTTAADTVSAFTFTASDGISPETVENLSVQLTALSGVSGVTVCTAETAADVGTHLLLFEGQTDGAGDVLAGSFDSFGDVTLRIANEITNAALDFTFSPNAEGTVTVLMPTSGPTVGLDLAVGDRIIVRGRTQDGDAGATLRTLTIGFIRRGSYDGMTLLLNERDYAALAAEGSVTFYQTSTLPQTLAPQDGIVLALPADAANEFAAGETVTLQHVRFSEKKSYDNGTLTKFITSADAVLHGTAAQNGLSGEDCLETFVSAVVTTDGTDTGYLLYSPAAAAFAEYGPAVTGVTGIMELKTKDGTLYALQSSSFALAADAAVAAGQNLSLPSYPTAEEVYAARTAAASNPSAYTNVELDDPDAEYNHIRYYVTDSFTVGGQTITVGFRRLSGGESSHNPFTPIVTYGQAYVMETGDSAVTTGAELLLTSDQIKSGKYTSDFGNLSANNNWILTADDTVAPGCAVLELPSGFGWHFAAGDVLHAARAQQVNLRKYVEDTAMLTDPTVLLETQLQYVSYLYDNLTITSVTVGTAEVPVVHVCAADAAKLAGRTYFSADAAVYVDKSITAGELAAAANALDKIVQASVDAEGNASCAYDLQNEIIDVKVWFDGSFVCGSLCHGILVLGLTPLIWLFTQNGHYKKRKKDLDLMYAIGKSDNEIARLLQCEAGTCGVLTAVVTALLAYPVCHTVEKTLSLPDVPLSSVRIGVLPYLAVVLAAGAVAAAVTYICARRCSPAAQKGGAKRGHS